MNGREKSFEFVVLQSVGNEKRWKCVRHLGEKHESVGEGGYPLAPAEPEWHRNQPPPVLNGRLSGYVLSSKNFDHILVHHV